MGLVDTGQVLQKAHGPPGAGDQLEYPRASQMALDTNV